VGKAAYLVDWVECWMGIIGFNLTMSQYDNEPICQLANERMSEFKNEAI
jgi:hypothetical protein